MHSISWSIDGRRADLRAIKAVLAAERRETTARHAAERQRVVETNRGDIDAKKVGAAIRKAVREQDKAKRRSIGAVVAVKASDHDGGRTCKRFEAMPLLDVPKKPSARGRDGLSSFHFRWTSRGNSGAGARGSRRYRAGEAARHLKYIMRELAREIAGGGLVSNVSRDPAELAAFFDALETLESQDRANANVYVTLVIALPHELTGIARERVLGEICEVLDKLGLPFAAVLHAPDPQGDGRNHHAHVMLSLRPARVVAPGQYEFSSVKSSDLNDGSFIVEYRQTVAALLNAAMERGGHERRFTALSNAERGLAPRTKASGKSTPGQKNVERRAQKLADDRAKLRQNYRRMDLIAQLRERLGRLLAAPLRDFGAEIAVRRADIVQRSRQRQELASRAAQQSAAVAAAAAEPAEPAIDVDVRVHPLTPTPGAEPTGPTIAIPSSAPVARTQPLAPTVTNGREDVPTGQAPANQSLGTHTASARTPTPATSPISAPIGVARPEALQPATSPVAVLPAPLAGSPPATAAAESARTKRSPSPNTLRAREIMAAKSQTPPEPASLPTSAVPPIEPVTPATTVREALAPQAGTARVEASTSSSTPIKLVEPDDLGLPVMPVGRTAPPLPTDIRSMTLQKRLALVGSVREDIFKRNFRGDGFSRSIGSLADVSSLRLRNVSEIPPISADQRTRMDISGFSPRPGQGAADDARKLASGAKPGTPETAHDVALKSPAKTAPAPGPDPARRQHIATPPAVRRIAPVDSARTAAIETVVRDLGKRTYLPLIRQPDGRLKLVPPKDRDDLLIVADRIDSDASVQAAFERARRTMLRELAGFFEICQGSPFDAVTRKMQLARLGPDLKQAVIAAGDDPDLQMAMREGRALWRWRDEQAFADEEKKRRQTAAERSQREKRRRALDDIHAEVQLGRLPGGWTSTDLTEAETPLAVVVPVLTDGKVWLARTESSYVVYGHDDRVEAAVQALARTPIGQAILERLATAIAQLRPDREMDAATLEVRCTATLSDDGVDPRLLRGARDGR